MIELDIAACEHTLRELRDLIVPRDRVKAFNDASMVLLKHFVMHMAAAWHSDDTASIAPVVVSIAFLVANRVMHPKHITAAAMAKATRRLPGSAKVLNDIAPAVVTNWVERFTETACQEHSFEPAMEVNGSGTAEFCRTCLVAKTTRATRRPSASVIVKQTRKNSQGISTTRDRLPFHHSMRERNVVRRRIRARITRPGDGTLPIRGYTKEQDEAIIEGLFRDKSYADFASMFKKSHIAIITHVKRNFGVARCEKHDHFARTCPNCQKSVLAWRENGSRIIAATRYIADDQAPLPPGNTVESKQNYNQWYNERVRMPPHDKILKEMQSHFHFSEEIMNNSSELLASFAGKVTKVIVAAAILIELEKAGMTMHAKDLLPSLATFLGKEPRQIRQARAKIARRMKVHLAPSSFVDTFAATPLVTKFSKAELVAINAYLRILDEYPMITSGRPMRAFIATVIHAALTRIGTAISEATVARWCGVSQAALHDRLDDIKQVENQLSDDALFVATLHAGGLLANDPAAIDAKPHESGKLAKRIARIKDFVDELCKALDISEEISNRARLLLTTYPGLGKNGAAKTSLQLLAAAVVLIVISNTASLKIQTRNILNRLAACIDKKPKYILQAKRTILQQLDVKPERDSLVDIFERSQIAESFSNAARSTTITYLTALDKHPSFVGAKSKNGLIAAVSYVVLKRIGEKVTQDELAERFGVNSSTINDRARDIHTIEKQVPGTPVPKHATFTQKPVTRGHREWPALDLSEITASQETSDDAKKQDSNDA